MLLDSLLDDSNLLLMIMKLLMFSSLQVKDVDSVSDCAAGPSVSTRKDAMTIED